MKYRLENRYRYASARPEAEVRKLKSRSSFQSGKFHQYYNAADSGDTRFRVTWSVMDDPWTDRAAGRCCWVHRRSERGKERRKNAERRRRRDCISPVVEWNPSSVEIPFVNFTSPRRREKEKERHVDASDMFGTFGEKEICVSRA